MEHERIVVSRCGDRNGKPNRLTAFASFLSVKLLGVVPTARSSTFYTAGSLDKRQPDAYREDLTTVLNLLAQGEISPVVGKQLPLADAAAAHELLSGSSTGKTILTCADAQSPNFPAEEH